VAPLLYFLTSLGRSPRIIGDSGASPGALASEAFKPRRADADPMRNIEQMTLDEDEEVLAPAVVVATIALLAVFAVGFVVSAIGLVL
jgi:hypothetical protein